MSMIEQLGEQMMEPMRHAVGDALAVAEEQTRRYRYALEALNGNYPGGPGLRVNGHANGHANGYALDGTPVAALPQASEEPGEPQEFDEDRVDPRRVSVRDAVDAVLRSAARKGYVGVTEIPGAMKAFEVVEVLDAWGWRDRSSGRTQTIMSTLCTLAKDGKAVRVERGTYAYVGLSADRIVILDEEGQPVDPNAVSIKALVRHVIRGAGGEALRPIQVVGRMEAAGWTNRNEHRTNTVRSFLARMMADGSVVRPVDGMYAWNMDQGTEAASPEPAPAPTAPSPVDAAPKVKRPQPSGRKRPGPDGPTGEQLVTAVLQGSPGTPMVAREVMTAMVQTGWTSTSTRPLGVVQACLAALTRKNPHVTRPELGQYVYTP